MTIEEIERLSIEDLQRMADSPQAVMPGSLSERLQEFACAAVLAERGTEALAERAGDAAARRRPARWAWGVVPAAALAALALVLLLRSPQRPKDTFTDPTLAYIEMARAFSIFNEAMQDIARPIVSNPETD
jgi:hypothetical protein